jgi:hypothetical protein
MEWLLNATGTFPGSVDYILLARIDGTGRL